MIGTLVEKTTPTVVTNAGVFVEVGIGVEVGIAVAKMIEAVAVALRSGVAVEADGS